MRNKEKKTVVTFHTTSDAMAMERYCRNAGIAGRIIPVPRELSAGCGMAFMGEKSQYDIFSDALKKAGIDAEGIHVCML